MLMEKWLRVKEDASGMTIQVLCESISNASTRLSDRMQ